MIWAFGKNILTHQNKLTSAAVPLLHSQFHLALCVISFPIHLCLMMPVTASSTTLCFASVCPNMDPSDDCDERY